MKFETTYFGDIDIEDSKVIQFEEGLPGFEDKNRFIILNNYDTDEPVPFMWLQSLEDPELAFVISIPFFLRPNYEIDIPTEACERIGLEEPEQAAIYTICKIDSIVESMSFNLRSPIIINSANKKGIQVVLSDPRYTSRELFKIPMSKFTQV